MTTAKSSVKRIREQADAIASRLKKVERGEPVVNDPAGKLAAARKRESIKVGIAMDDGVRFVDLPWVTIRGSTEKELSEFIVSVMRKTDTTHGIKRVEG